MEGVPLPTGTLVVIAVADSKTLPTVGQFFRILDMGPTGVFIELELPQGLGFRFMTPEQFSQIVWAEVKRRG